MGYRPMLLLTCSCYPWFCICNIPPPVFCSFLWRAQLLCIGQRGFPSNLSEIKHLRWFSAAGWLCKLWARQLNQTKHNSPKNFHSSLSPSGHAKGVVEVRTRTLSEIFWLFCFVLYLLPGLLTAVTRICMLQERYFCSHVLCLFFYIRFSNSAGICVICPSFLDF